MSAVLDRPSQMAAERNGACGPSSRAGQPCPECRARYVARQRNQLFCCNAHKRAYNNRWVKRGAVLAPLYAAARATRGGTRGDKVTGAAARAAAEQLAQRWKDEDEAAGRLSAVEYIAARRRFGMVEVV